MSINFIYDLHKIKLEWVSLISNTGEPLCREFSIQCENYYFISILLGEDLYAFLLKVARVYSPDLETPLI